MPRARNSVNVSSFTTSAKFRAWGSTVSSAIQTAGLVQTSNPNQANWFTANHPGTANTFVNGEIYAFNDSLQSSAPIFVRIYYGTGSGTSGNNMYTGIQIGTQNDISVSAGSASALSGIGMVTGISSSMFAGVGSAANNTSQTVLACHTDGYFMLYIGGHVADDSSISPGIWIIDRLRDSNGNPTGKGYTLTYPLGSSTAYVMQRTVVFDTGYVFSDYKSPMMYYDTASTGGYALPYYAITPQPKLSMGACGIMVGAAPRFSTFQLDTFNTGASHTYLSLGTSPQMNPAPFASDAATVTNDANLALAVLWED